MTFGRRRVCGVEGLRVAPVPDPPPLALLLQGLSTRTQETYETLKHEKPPQ